MRQFASAVDEATRFRLEDRHALACDVRAAMATDDSFTKHLDGLKPKR